MAMMVATSAKSNAQMNYTTSWVGNTGGGANDQWMQMTAGALYVEPNGTCYVNSFYDEGGHEAGIYIAGNVIGEFQALHGWDRSGGCSITADAKYVYVGMQQSDCGNTGNMPGFPVLGTDASGGKLRETWWGVRRYFKNGLPAPWTQLGRNSGVKNSIIGMNDNSMLIVSDLSYPNAKSPTNMAITGLAAVNGLLYVSDPYTNSIRVYNIGSSDHVSQTSSWSVSNPGSLAYDRNSRTLWVAQLGGPASPSVVLHYTLDGQALPQQITNIGAAAGIAFDPQGNLMVADGGPDQQIKVYNNLGDTPTLVKLIGNQGGIYSGVRGQVADGKFNGLIGAGADAQGNVYAATNGATTPTSPGTGATLASYAPDLHKIWDLNGLEFMDGADVDPASDGADIYTAQEHFTLDLSHSGAKPQYAGFTVDQQRYPDDPRLHIRGSGAPMVRRIAGKPFLFVTDSHSSCMQIYRFDPANSGETAIPSGIIATHSMMQFQDSTWLAGVEPTTGAWIWRDLDGNGDFYTAGGAAARNEFDSGRGAADPWTGARIWAWSVDSNGDVWQASRSGGASGGVRHFHCQGLDAVGNPIYSMANSDITPTPLPFDASKGGINRIQYVAGTDTMYLCGYTAQYPTLNGENGPLGRVVVRYDHWSTLPRTPTYQIVLPYNSVGTPMITPMALSVSGDKIFIGYLGGVTPDYNSGGQIAVYSAATGAPIEVMTPGPEVGGVSGWIDLANGMNAFTRSTGEQIVFAEEDFMAKVLMYHIQPPNVASAALPAAVNGAGTGLTARYYDDSSTWTPFTKCVLTEIDPDIDGLWSSSAPNSSVGQNFFSICWSGQIQPRYSEMYTFHTVSDDGIRVWIDGKMVVDAWKSHGEQTDFGSIPLAAGQLYDIRVEYYQRTNRARASLFWSSASQSREIVPASQLYPEAAQSTGSPLGIKPGRL